MGRQNKVNLLSIGQLNKPKMKLGLALIAVVIAAPHCAKSTSGSPAVVLNGAKKMTGLVVPGAEKKVKKNEAAKEARKAAKKAGRKAAKKANKKADKDGKKERKNKKGKKKNKSEE